jgi:hypothetical protein
MILEPAFRFWPIESIQEIRGWMCGTYATLHSQPYRELLERGRLGARRRKRGAMRRVTKAQVEASFLHHEALGAALETEGVLRETFEFSEQAFFDPTALVSSERAESALLRFMELPQGDTAKAIGYLRDFGDFGGVEPDEQGDFDVDLPTEVTQLWAKCDKRNREGFFALDLQDFWKARQKIQGFWDLNTALIEKNQKEAQRHCSRIRPDFTFDPKTNWLAVGKALLCADLSSSLNPGRHNPRLILRERNGNLVLQTMCMNVRTALYLILLEKVLSGTGYTRCGNKDCPMYFMIVKGKKYHSLKCQNAAKVRRFREKQVQLETG